MDVELKRIGCCGVATDGDEVKFAVGLLFGSIIKVVLRNPLLPVWSVTARKTLINVPVGRLESRLNPTVENGFDPLIVPNPNSPGIVHSKSWIPFCAP